MAMMPGVIQRGLALRISVTERCQFRCLYCRPRWMVESCEASAPREATDVLTVADIVRFVRVAQQSLGVAKVRLTGGEPLVRSDIVAIVAALAGLGVPDLALTTNGQQLDRLARPLRTAGLERVNVSLDSLAESTFARLAQASGVADVLDGIAAASAAGLAPLRINTVVLRGINDHEAESIIEFALGRGHEARFIELMPSGLSAEDYRRWFMSSDELRARLERSFAFRPTTRALGSSSRRFHVTGAGLAGFVGFISPNSHPFCSGCRRLRLTANGSLLGCLGRRDRIEIRALLRAADPASDERIAAALSVALGCKRGEGTFAVAVPMSQVGG
jgi:cyclic pyranopterin phosphate synthase